MLGIVRAAGLSRSVEVTVLKEAVFKRETLLLSLTPLLVVKVDVGALLIFIIDDLRFLMPLEPHHVLCVEPPTLLLESLCCQVLRLRALHVVEDEEQRLCAQPLEEVYRIASRRRCLNGNHVQDLFLYQSQSYLGVVKWSVAGVARQVWPEPF